MKSKMKTRKLLTAFVLLMVALIAGCVKDEFPEIVGVCPAVESTSPADNDMGVSLSKVITVTFNEEINPATLTATSFTIQGLSPVAGSITYSGKTASFTPTNPLAENVTYTGRITTAVKDMMGNAIQEDYVWTFSTDATPVITYTSPSNDEGGVLLNKVIEVQFSMDMTPSTLNETTFMVKRGTIEVPGAVSYNGTSLLFRPAANLLPDAEYTATVTTGAKSLAGISIAEDYVWSFSTGQVPEVLSTDPLSNAVSVALDKIVSVKFNMTMDPLSLMGTTFTIKQGTTPVLGSVTYNGTDLFFIPSGKLIPGTEYTATINTNARSSAGISMAEDYVWKFTTALVDVPTVPTVTATNPVNLATGVALDKVVTAKFSMLMDPLTLNGATFTLFRGTTKVNGTITYNGDDVSFLPLANLLPGTEYTATITTGAKSLAGVGIASNYIWKFTTGTTSAPVVISTNPINLTTGVALDKVVSAKFSMLMDPLTLNGSSFTLFRGTTKVDGVVSYNGDDLSFVPSANLLPGTEYTATITTGAKNLAGVGIASNYIWKFTTGTATAPSVTSTNPVNLATGVALDKVVTAKFSMVMDPLTLNGSTFTIFRGTTKVDGTVTYNGEDVSFLPSANLLPGTEYTATITTGAKNLAGVGIASNYIWKFTTGTATAPSVTSTNPVNLATGVALDKVVTAKFSMVMDPLTLNGSTFTIFRGTTKVDGTVTYNGEDVSFLPSANLLPGTEYTATITTGAKNLAGVGIASNYIWKFSTVAAVPPTIIATNPINLTTGVVLNKVVTATFSVPMDPLTITETSFTLFNGTTAVQGTVTYANTVAYFTPSSDLLPETEYTATVTTAVKNLSGTAMENNYVWKFTTKVVVVEPLFSSIFGSFGGNAGITNQGIYTVINNGSIGTTAASTLVTGFHDSTGDVYSETPLNIGDVKGRIYTDAPAPVIFATGGPYGGNAATMAKAQEALLAARNFYISISPASKPGGITLDTDELGGRTLAPGIYKSGGTYSITSVDLTLDAQGDANAVWIFQVPSALTVGTPTGARSIVLINGAQAKNVYWYVGTSAVINYAGGGTMVGTIIAELGVTLSSPDNSTNTTVQTVLNGRAISLVSSVTMVNTVINVPQ
jgi:hypothetical protein